MKRQAFQHSNLYACQSTQMGAFMKKKIVIKDILLLQSVFIIYSISSVIAKFASEQNILSFPFVFFACLEVAILGLYAILWQQIIKKFELSIAYANKAMTLLWGLLWGFFIFHEKITAFKVCGILLVIIGILIMNGEKEKNQ